MSIKIKQRSQSAVRPRLCREFWGEGGPVFPCLSIRSQRLSQIEMIRGQYLLDQYGSHQQVHKVCYS